MIDHHSSHEVGGSAATAPSSATTRRVFRARRQLAWLALAASLACASPEVAYAQAPAAGGESLARADELYRQGNDAFKRGDLQGALKAYEEAYRLKPSFDIAGNLGAVEMQLGHHRNAAEHLTASLRTAPVNGKPEVRQKTTDLLRDAKTHVAAVFVTTSEPGADIEVDGKPVGRTELPQELFLEPGHHAIVAKRGDKSARHEADFAAGTTGDVLLELKASSAPPPPPPGTEPPSTPPDEKTGPPLWPGFVIGGVGLVGVGVGVGLIAAGGGAQSDADDAAAALRADGATCSASGEGPPGCADVTSSLSDADGLRTGGTIALIAGSAALAGGVVYLVWAATSDGSGGSSDAATSVRPWVGPGLAVGGLQGEF